MMRIFGGLLLASLMTGCASWALKEKCENTNWFEYSQKIANEGRYLEEDELVKQCKSVEKINLMQIDQGFKLGREKMCSYEEIKARGREGVPVFFDFCTGLDPQLMRAQFAEGLKTFCVPEKAYTYGRSGKIYQKLCTPQTELKFFPSYAKGRVEFLTEQIANFEKEKVTLSDSISGLEVSEQMASRNLDNIPRVQSCGNKSVYNEGTHKDEVRLVCEEPSYIRTARDSMMQQVSGIRSKLSEERENLQKLNDKLSQARQHLAELPKTQK